MSGPTGIRLQSVLSGRTEIYLSGAPLTQSIRNLGKRVLAILNIFEKASETSLFFHGMRLNEMLLRYHVNPSFITMVEIGDKFNYNAFYNYKSLLELESTST